MKFTSLVFMTSCLYKSPTRDPYISDNGHVKHEHNF